MAPVAKNFKVKNGLDVAGTATATLFSGSGASLTSIPQSAITNLSTDLSAKAPLASPTFTGTLTAPTIVGTDTTDSSSSTTGALKTAGGLGVAKKLYVGTSMVAGGALVGQHPAGGYAVSYHDVASLNGGNLTPGAWVLTTPLPRAAGLMGQIRVYGHRYYNYIIDFTISFYLYAGGTGPDGLSGQLIAYYLNDNGSDGLNKYIGIKNGNLAIAIGQTTDSIPYMKVNADSFLTASPSTGYETGWAWATTPNTTTSPYTFGWDYAPILLTASTRIVTNGAQTFPGIKTFSDTTDASSTTTGSVIVSGGLGVAKKLYLGGNLYAQGGVTAMGSAANFALLLDNAASDSSTNKWRIAPTGSAWAAGDNKLVFTYESTDSSTSKLTIDGPNSRVGINKNAPTVALDVTGAGAFSSTISASGLAGSLLSSATPTTPALSASTGTSAIPSRQDHVHPVSNLIASSDTRNTNTEPQNLSAALYADFKANATTSLSDGGSYHGLLTFRAYSTGTDFSGGYPLQLGFTANNRMWMRTATGATTWGTWRTFVDTDSTQTVAGAKTFSGNASFGAGLSVTAGTTTFSPSVTFSGGISIPATAAPALGSELGDGVNMTQTVTTVVGTVYLVTATTLTACTITPAGSAGETSLLCYSNRTSFVATATSHTLTGTGTGFLSVKAVTANSASGTLAGQEFRGSNTGNLGIGLQALRLNSANFNTGIGYQALIQNTTGPGNAAVGYYALGWNLTGGYNSAVGYASLAGNVTGDANSAFGIYALYSNQVGNNNTALGYAAGYYTTGSFNVAVGLNAGRGGATTGVTGTNNTFVGTNAGRAYTTGSYNLALGTSTFYSGSTGTVSGSVAIGTNSSGTGAQVTANNTIVLGTSSHTTLVPGDSQFTGQINVVNGTPTVIKALKGSQWGYSSGYRVVVLGDTGTDNKVTVSIGYDPSGNASGSFQGNGSEVLFRNGMKFLTPNTGNTNFLTALTFNTDGSIKPGIGLDISAVSDTATTASHYLVETGSDGFVRPKTLANVRTEIVTTAAVNAAAATTLGTLSSDLTISKASAGLNVSASSGTATAIVAAAGTNDSARLTISGKGSGSSSLRFQQNSSNRWLMSRTNEESTANAGSDFYLQSYDDAGALLSTPLSITRATGNATFGANLNVTGDLVVNGTTFTTNSTTVTIDDPVFTLGGDTAPTVDDNKDRGIEFRYHNGTSAKVGFFGYDDSVGGFSFIPDATNTSEVFSGTRGTIYADAFSADTSVGINGGPSWINDGGKWRTTANVRIDGSSLFMVDNSASIQLGGTSDVALTRTGAAAASFTGSLNVVGASSSFAVPAASTNEFPLVINQGAAAAAAHLQSKGDGYLGWIGTRANGTRRFAFESSGGNSWGAHFGLYFYDSGGANVKTAFVGNYVNSSSNAALTFYSDTVFNGAVTIGSVSNTEIGYLDGVTSAIQTQLDGKAASSHTHAQSDITNLTTDLAAKAPLASPALTGTPTAPTATAGTNTTQIATTAFVTTALSAAAGGATVSDTAPSSPSAGDQWIDSTTARLYAYIDSTWVEVGPTPQVQGNDANVVVALQVFS